MTINKWFQSGKGILFFSILATMLWGSAFPFIKISYLGLGIDEHDQFQQLLFAGYRFTLSGISFNSKLDHITPKIGTKNIYMEIFPTALFINK